MGQGEEERRVMAVISQTVLFSLTVESARGGGAAFLEIQQASPKLSRNVVSHVDLAPYRHATYHYARSRNVR
jgi:hypothetical protein